jgi:hypothetical protein
MADESIPDEPNSTGRGAVAPSDLDTRLLRPATTGDLDRPVKVGQKLCLPGRLPTDGEPTVLRGGETDLDIDPMDRGHTSLGADAKLDRETARSDRDVSAGHRHAGIVFEQLSNERE